LSQHCNFNTNEIESETAKSENVGLL